MTKPTHDPSDPQPITEWRQLRIDHRKRLAGYGIFSPADWSKLSRDRQLGLFGVSESLRSQLDALARSGARS